MDIFTGNFIDVGRFRILCVCVGGGRAKFRIFGEGGKGAANSQQAHDVVLKSMRRTTSHGRHFDAMCPLGF